MWKWIGGALVLILVVLVGASWWGYRTLTEGGDAVAVDIAGSPQRIFASLANHDSLRTWRLLDDQSQTPQHGPLALGDNLPSGSSRSRFGRSKMHWIATALEPDRLVAFALMNDSTGAVIATRRDSIIRLGDSTRIVSTIASPLMDSLRFNGPDGAERRGGAMIDASSKLLVSSFRMQSKVELTRLKDRIEGRPGASPRP